MKTFRRLDPPWNTGQKKFSKKLPQNMFKTRLRTFGNDFGQLWNFEIFSIFWKHFEYSTLHGTLGKKNFRKNYLKTCSKRVCALLGTILGFLELWKFFDFLKTFRRLDPPWNTGQKKISKKLPQNMFKTRLRTFGNDFGQLWNFEIFSIFWKHFEYSTLHGTLGKINFSKKLPQNMFKTLLDNLGTILGVFGILNFLNFFKNISKTRPPWNTGQKKFSKKLPQNMFKTRLRTFGNDFGQLWNFEIFSIFWKHFEYSTLHGTLGKKNFRKNYLKTCSKRVCALLGTILGFFGILKVFWFFKNISQTRPSMEHWAKKIFEKITPKHVQNTFAHFWERFWAIMEFWNIFDFLKTFRILDPPWNTGQKNCSKNLTQHLFKTRLRTFGNDFGQLWKFEKFFIF